MLYAVECMGRGGPAACAQRHVALTSDSAESAQALAEAAAHQARQEADLQEAQQVLARFTGNNSSARWASVQTRPVATYAFAHYRFCSRCKVESF